MKFEKKIFYYESLNQLCSPKTKPARQTFLSSKPEVNCAKNKDFLNYSNCRKSKDGNTQLRLFFLQKKIILWRSVLKCQQTVCACMFYYSMRATIGVKILAFVNALWFLGN